MIIKIGVVVCHSGASSWGVGKVIEVAGLKATIQFSDGTTRKIASSHYANLQPADPASFVAHQEHAPNDKVRTTPRKPKKTKAPAVYSDGTPR